MCEGEEARTKEERRKSHTCLLSVLPVVSVKVVGVFQPCVCLQLGWLIDRPIYFSLRSRCWLLLLCKVPDYLRACVRVCGDRTGLMMSLVDLGCQLLKVLIAHCFFFPTVFLHCNIVFIGITSDVKPLVSLTLCASDVILVLHAHSGDWTGIASIAEYLPSQLLSVVFCFFYLSLSSPSNSCSSLHNPSNLLSSAAHYSSVSLCLPLSVLTLQVNCCPCLSSISLQKCINVFFFNVLVV